MRTRPKSAPLMERFWRHVDKRSTDECWSWLASVNAGGYGKIGNEGRRGWMAASRASWLIHNGPIPPGLCVLHRCDNPPCVNPSHLFLGTLGDNNRDTASKGRQWMQVATPDERRAHLRPAIEANIAKSAARVIPECVRCGGPARIRRKGRCDTCSAYLRRTGRERPARHG